MHAAYDNFYLLRVAHSSETLDTPFLEHYYSIDPLWPITILNYNKTSIILRKHFKKTLLKNV